MEGLVEGHGLAVQVLSALLLELRWPQIHMFPSSHKARMQAKNKMAHQRFTILSLVTIGSVTSSKANSVLREKKCYSMVYFLDLTVAEIACSRRHLTLHRFPSNSSRRVVNIWSARNNCLSTLLDLPLYLEETGQNTYETAEQTPGMFDCTVVRLKKYASN